MEDKTIRLVALFVVGIGFLLMMGVAIYGLYTAESPIDFCRDQGYDTATSRSGSKTICERITVQDGELITEYGEFNG